MKKRYQCIVFAFSIMLCKFASVTPRNNSSSRVATPQNQPNTVVKRNKFGNFAANKITANRFNGLASLAQNFTNALGGDVTGNQTSTVVGTVGGKSASAVAASVDAVSNATAENIFNTLVKRDHDGHASFETLYLENLYVSDLIANTEPFLVEGSPFAGGGISSPNGMSIDHDGNFVAVCNPLASTISMFRIDKTSGTLTPIIGSPFSSANLSSPQYVSFSQDSRFFAVTCQSPTPHLVVYSVDTSSGVITEMSTYPLPNDPFGLSYSPDGKWLAVASQSGYISMFSVNITTGILTEIAGSPFSVVPPYTLAFCPFTCSVAATNPDNDTISIYKVNQSTGALTEFAGSPFDVSALPRSSTAGKTLNEPRFLAISPLGDFLVVSNVLSNQIVIFSIDPDAEELSFADSVGINAPNEVVFSPDGLFVAVAERTSAPQGHIRIFAVDLHDGLLHEVSGSNIDVGQVPYYLRYVPNGSFLIVLAPDNNKLAVINTSNNIFLQGGVAVTGNLELNNSTPSGGIIRIGGKNFAHAAGEANTFIGDNAGNFIVSGINNIAIGTLAMQHVTTGSGNIAIGRDAGNELRTGSNNIYISAEASSASESDTIRIGTDATSCYISGIDGATSASGVPVLVNASGQLGTMTSSQKYKKNICDVSNEVLDNLKKIRSVEFEYNEELDPAGIKQYGFLAEEVAQVCPELVVFKDGKPETIRYQLLTPLLLGLAQDQQKKIDELEKNYQNLSYLSEKLLEKVLEVCKS